MKTLGKHIRELREKKDLSVRELAKRIKVTPSFLSDVELGRSHPSEDVLGKLARALDTTVVKLQKHDARPSVMVWTRYIGPVEWE